MNAAAEGKVYPAVTFEVASEHIARFAEVVGQVPPGVPPTFLTAAEFAVFPEVIADPELGLDFTRVVHGEQEYVLHRAPEPGETLTGRSRIASIRERGGHGFLTVEMQLRDAADLPVATARATMIERPVP